MEKIVSEDIQNFHKIQSEIANLNVKLNKLEKQIVSKECPYKKGQKVIFNLYESRHRSGIIECVNFKGVDFDAIDNKWLITIRPTTKDFTKINKVVNHAVTIGKSKNEKLIKIVSE